jgi:hypothetical protein
LIPYCYYSMFYGCSKLNYIKMLATDISDTTCLFNWVSGVASTGTFVKHPNMTSLTTGPYGIPSGWTVQESIESYPASSAGDVAYYDGSMVKIIPVDKWQTSLGIPIGVVVIPSDFLPDGMARLVSLKGVNSTGNAVTSPSSMVWSSMYSLDTSLTDHTQVPLTTNSDHTATSSSSYGKLPSDNFTGDTSYVDSSAKYDPNGGKIPSPYFGNEFNQDYSKVLSGNNALSDFNGLSNTEVLIGNNKHTAAKAAYKYTDGTSNTQWYLPAMGELGFLVARLKTINSTLSTLGGVAIPLEDLWSSTEGDKFYAYRANMADGQVFAPYKDFKCYVRPFALLDNAKV